MKPYIFLCVLLFLVTCLPGCGSKDSSSAAAPASSPALVQPQVPPETGHYTLFTGNYVSCSFGFLSYCLDWVETVARPGVSDCGSAYIAPEFDVASDGTQAEHDGTTVNGGANVRAYVIKLDWFTIAQVDYANLNGSTALFPMDGSVVVVEATPKCWAAYTKN